MKLNFDSLREGINNTLNSIENYVDEIIESIMGKLRIW